MAVTGLRTTYQSITTENRLVRVPDEDLLMLEPKETALVSFLLGMKKKNRMIDSPRIESFEDDYMGQWITTSAQTNANAASDTISSTDASMVVVGDLLLVPSGSSSNHEMVRVTAKPSANVCTVARNVGSTGLLTIASGAGLMILGQAFEEGADSPTAKITTLSTVTNYTQIFKKAIELTRTDANSKHYADSGSERQRLLTKAAKEFKIQKNLQYYWGKPSESLTGGPSGNPIRTTGGIDHYIATNRYDVGGVMTKKTMETFARMAFRYTQNAVLFASPLLISAIHDWGNSFLKIGPREQVFGVDVHTVVTGHGEWKLVRDWQLRDGVSGQNGFGGYGFSLDMDYIQERVLKGSDTAIKKDVQSNEADKHKDMIMCESGLQIRQEERHARIYGITDYSA
jgi:hypothetical protein